VGCGRLWNVRVGQFNVEGSRFEVFHSSQSRREDHPKGFVFRFFAAVFGYYYVLTVLSSQTAFSTKLRRESHLLRANHIQYPVQQEVFPGKKLHAVFVGFVRHDFVDVSMRLFSSGGEALRLSSARLNHVDSGCHQIAGATKSIG
jgi:hypothetical protein